ncbi:MAG: LysE family translocator [Aeromicrobium sp.]
MRNPRRPSRAGDGAVPAPLGRDGRAAGLAAVVGNEIGIFGWTIAGGAGLSVLLTANRALSTALHVIGAVILIWLGISAWRQAKLGAEIEVPVPPRGRTPASAFRASLISIAANPKAAAFGIAVVPQFLPSSGPVLPTPHGAPVWCSPPTGPEICWGGRTFVVASNASSAPRSSVWE